MQILALVGSPRKRGNTDILVDTLLASASDDAKLLVEMLSRVFRALKMEHTGTVLGTAYDKGDILGDTSAMDAAKRVGRFGV